MSSPDLAFDCLGCRGALRRRCCGRLGTDLEEFLGIDRVVVHQHLVVQMRPGAAAGAAELAQPLVRAYPLAARHRDAMEMREARDDAVAMVDLDRPAVAA